MKSEIPEVPIIQEVECLLSLVEQFKDILENKETDMVTWKLKEKAWVNLSENFNSMWFPTRAPRQLREKWSNIKKYSFKKNELYKTGGGNPQVCMITQKDERVKELIGVAVTGLENDYDDDSHVHNSEQLISGNIDETWATWNPQSLRKPVSEQLSVVETQPQNSGPTWSAMQITLQHLEKLMKQKSEAGSKKCIKVTPNQLGIASTSGFQSQMLRLVHSEIASNQIEETNNDGSTARKFKKNASNNQLYKKVKINCLSEAKLELIKIQQQCLINEERRKEEEHTLEISQMKAEHEMRIKKFHYEVEILKRNLE
ncbi:unnamed protein product [Psylliodes chrysocephalus]|uniref:Regulatory protein zeste n=1 Tax=Psylliodes chrysocephalus TaxID=3402493 RepID=A0A9P0GFI5_9CUCU|nr:unnamed protein product [Psylliodes chrysocephala]